MIWRMELTTLIIRTAGTNCDRELAAAFELAGAATRTVHMNRLIAEPSLIDGSDVVALPGGFSYGDDVAAGRIFANRLRQRLFESLRRAIDRGVPVIGICNGFQVLVKMGLLPDPGTGRQLATLAENAGGRFVDKWVGLVVPEGTVCIWSRGLDRFELPIAHGEGRFLPADDRVLATLQSRGQIALRYSPGNGRGSGPGAAAGPAGGNPNGSVEDIAGICDPSGLVLGLMPHPERFTHPTHHPQWTRLGEGFLMADPAGLRLIRNGVEHVRAAPAAAATQRC